MALQSPLDQADPTTVQSQMEEIDFSKATEERILPLSDPHFNGSGLLRRVHQLLLEVQARAQLPAFTTHVATLIFDELKNQYCSICKEELETNITNKDRRESHAPVITSCRHIFGGDCLSTWLANAKSRSCLYCRKDFNEVPENCGLTWKTWGDILRWFEDRKHSKSTCRQRHCGRYLWDNCSFEEIQAQFDMQEEIPISPEYWIYVILGYQYAFEGG